MGVGVLALHIALLCGLQLWMSPQPKTGHSEVDTVAVSLRWPARGAALTAPVPKRGVQGLAAVKRESSRPLLSAVRSTQPVTEVMRLETVVATTAPLPPLNAARAPAEPLNLTLSQQALADSVAKTGFARARPQPDASGRQWQAFAQKFGPNDEITEERLADGGVQVRSKHGCYRIVPSATQRLDPYNWSPSYVIQSNQDTSKWCSDGNGFVAGTREGKGTPLGGRALHRVSDCRS